MSNPYETAKGGKLTFKGGIGVEKTIDKKKKNKKNKKKIAADQGQTENQLAENQDNNNANGTGYTIDVTTRKNYEELFPFETKKFGYAALNPKSAADALDERVKKKADRYCK
eukprot:Gb_18897 [translate_table: standard]